MPADISALAHSAIYYVRSRTSADTLALLAERYPAASPSETARACRHAVGICRDQGELELANMFAPIVEEAQRRDIAALIPDCGHFRLTC